MKCTAFAVAWLSVIGVANAQSVPIFVWDYTAEDVAERGTDRFEIQIDGGDWDSVGMTEHTPGTYRSPVPQAADGEHVMAIRACAGATCEDVATMTYTTTLVFTAVKVGSDVDIVVEP